MSKKPHPTIADARSLAKRYKNNAVLVFWVTDDGHYGGVSYGKTKAKCSTAGNLLDCLMGYMKHSVSYLLERLAE